MEKYKDYLIESYSYKQEDRSWDGHRTSGDGTYTTHYSARIVDPETGKVLNGFDNLQETKDYIDKHFSEEGLKQKQTNIDLLEYVGKKIEETSFLLESLKRKELSIKRDIPREFR